MVRGYKELDVWKLSIDLVDMIYDATVLFPSDEKFGLSSQIKRAVVSIPSNIAEGSGRAGTKEFIQFINIAKGSLAEVETQLIIAYRRKFINIQTLELLSEKADRIDKMLYGLIKSLKRTME